MAYKVILEPGIGQFRELESPRVRTHINICGTYSSALIDLRKARERELATLDENRQSVGAEPYAPTIMKAKPGRGGKGTTPTCDHGLYVQKLYSRSVPKNKNTLQGMINQQSAVKSTSSKYEATQTYLSVTYQLDRLHLTGK